MNPTAQQIDQVVSSVVERLRVGATSQPEELAGHSLKLATQVVSLAEIERLPWNSQRRLQVSPHAVVTPAAKDWLKARQIEVVRGDTQRPISHALYAIATSEDLVPARWPALLSEHGVYLSYHVQPDLPSVAELANGHANDSAMTLILTTTPELAACLANRHQRVRAAAVQRPSDLSRLHGELGINALAIDPRRMSPYELHAIVTEASRLGPGSDPVAAYRVVPRRPK
jgi:hypothetical protein